jgi:hypothetical protein
MTPPPDDNAPPPGAQPSPPPPSQPGYAAPPPQYAQPSYSTPMPAAERVRVAWHRRNETDYIFDFWTALGWTILSCGIYGFYVLYQLIRRSRDHNLRRLELLDSATAFAWERAQAQGRDTELRPRFEAIAQHMATLRNQSTQFRDPTVWTIIAVFASGIVQIIAFILLDGDLVTHDYAEGAIENELAAIYGALGASVPPPDASRLKQKHNYVGRIIATILTCGIYGLWWEYDVMTEGNRHFQHNWAWEDQLASSVQQMLPAA